MAVRTERIYRVNWESGVPTSWEYPDLLIVAHHYRRMKSVSVIPIDQDGVQYDPLVVMLSEHINKFYKMEPKTRSSKILTAAEVAEMVWADRNKPEQADLFGDEADAWPQRQYPGRR